MTKQELNQLYESLVELENELKLLGAPGSIRSRAHAARLSVSWLIDYRNQT